jgi:hypothetical protein
MMPGMRLVEGITNTCQLFRHPRLALAMLRAEPRYFLLILRGRVSVSVRLHD